VSVRTGVPAQGTCVEDYDPVMLSAVIAELNEQKGS